MVYEQRKTAYGHTWILRMDRQPTFEELFCWGIDVYHEMKLLENV